MTLRTITSPYDLQTLTEIRTQVATKIGLAVANWSPNFASAVDRIIDSSADHVSKRFGHEPWMLHEVPLTLASGVSTVVLPDAVRKVKVITETYDTMTRQVFLASKEDYLLAWGTGYDTHPWNLQTAPHWYLNGMSDDNPPKQEWRRIPEPDQEVTATALCVPYLTMLSTAADDDTSHTHMPATASESTLEYVFMKVLRLQGEYEKAGQHEAAMERELDAVDMENNDRAHNAPITMELPNYVGRELYNLDGDRFPGRDRI